MIIKNRVPQRYSLSESVVLELLKPQKNGLHRLAGNRWEPRLFLVYLKGSIIYKPGAESFIYIALSSIIIIADINLQT